MYAGGGGGTYRSCVNSLCSYSAVIASAECREERKSSGVTCYGAIRGVESINMTCFGSSDRYGLDTVRRADCCSSCIEVPFDANKGEFLILEVESVIYRRNHYSHV